MRTVKAVVAWFVNVELDVPDDMPDDEVREALYQLGNERLVGANVECLSEPPVIHDSETDPDLVD